MFAGLVHNNEFWIAIAFVIFVVLAWRPMQARLAGVLDARVDQIKKQLDEAQQLREEAARALEECQRKQRDALKQAEEIVALARTEVERSAEETRANLVAALDRRRRLASDRIAIEEQKAVDDVRDMVVDVAIAAAAQILSGRLDEEHRSELIKQTLQGLQRRLH